MALRSSSGVRRTYMHSGEYWASVDFNSSIMTYDEFAACDELEHVKDFDDMGNKRVMVQWHEGAIMVPAEEEWDSVELRDAWVPGGVGQFRSMVEATENQQRAMQARVPAFAVEHTPKQSLYPLLGRNYKGIGSGPCAPKGRWAQGDPRPTQAALHEQMQLLAIQQAREARARGCPHHPWWQTLSGTSRSHARLVRYHQSPYGRQATCGTCPQGAMV